jgi:tellurite methyltransferase
MTHSDADKWNARYAADGETWLDRQPRPLLLEFAHLLPSQGLALDAAAGVANNGTYLARRGLRVIALDISEEGLRLARQRALAESLPLDTAVYDLAYVWLPANTFDLIVNFHFLKRVTFAAFRQSLKPGGLLIFETFLRLDDDTTSPDYYLQPGELQEAFSGFEIIHSCEGTIPGTDMITAQLVARKPVDPVSP